MTSDLVVVVGPTAAGKTALGVELARQLGGEVVSADAFAVYRGLDIGTAKPDAAAREAVRHHLIDIADPRERYSAGMFVRDADAAIRDIRLRSKVPVVVGGTHFYVRSLLYGLFREPEKDPLLRERLEREWRADPAGVRRRLLSLDPEAAARIGANDKQRILRALEVCILAGRPMSALWREQRRSEPRYAFRMFGVHPGRAALHARISLRVDAMFAAGLVAEVAGLLADGVPRPAHALKAIGYGEALRVIDGEWSEEQARSATEAATRRLAKRQMTWLRGEADVRWLVEENPVSEAVAVLEAGSGTGARP